MSEIRATTISDLAGTGPVTLTKQSAAKAWSYSIYSSGVPANTASFNVSSITDVGVGTQDPNFTSAFSGASYAVTLGSQLTATGAGSFFTQEGSGGKTSSKCRIEHYQASTLTDPILISVSAFGDLA